jgi:hypothetical protein
MAVPFGGYEDSCACQLSKLSEVFSVRYPFHYGSKFVDVIFGTFRCIALLHVDKRWIKYNTYTINYLTTYWTI